MDSLDECLMQIEKIGHILIGELSELPIKRLRMRIACRTAEWPRRLEGQLKSLWGEEVLRSMNWPRCAGLTSSKPRAHEIEPAATFIENVIHSGAVPLAIKPITLQFPLNTYRRCQSLPPDQGQLYADGCRLLCEESRDGLRQPRAAAI